MQGLHTIIAETYKAIVDKGKAATKARKSLRPTTRRCPGALKPFAERELKAKLSKRFKVSDIPSLVLLDGATGAVLAKDGRSVIMADQEGANFHWVPKSLDELIGGGKRRGRGAVPCGGTQREALGPVL